MKIGYTDGTYAEFTVCNAILVRVRVRVRGSLGLGLGWGFWNSSGSRLFSVPIIGSQYKNTHHKETNSALNYKQ